MNFNTKNNDGQSSKDFKSLEDIQSLKENFVTNSVNRCDELSFIDYEKGNFIITNNKLNKCISVFDVACYVLLKLKTCSTMKLHKLLYYCQAWYLVWEESPLFKEKIEAWVNGPVIRELFNYHKGMYEISYNNINIGNENKLNDVQKEDIDIILRFYGKYSAQWLINQTHTEAPWRKARSGLLPMERGNNEIQLSDMQEYYSSLK